MKAGKLLWIILPLFFAGCRASDPTDTPVADLLLFNGNIITVDSQFTIAEAIAIRDGTILGVGSAQDMEAFGGDRTRRVNLGGKTVTPGFIDGHPHMLAMNDVSLTDVQSVEDILGVVSNEAEKRQPEEWIILEPPGAPPFHFHMPEQLVEGRFPTREELDQAAPENPVYMKSSDFHEAPTSIFNTRALEALGITPGSSPIDYVEVVRERDGTPSGYVIGNLAYFSQSPLRNRLVAIAPRYSLEEEISELQRDMARYNAAGVTAIYEGHGMSGHTIDVYSELGKRDAMTVRSYLVKTIDTAKPIEAIADDLDEMSDFAGDGSGDDLLRVGGIGVGFGDNVGFGAGLMRQPYISLYGQRWDGLQLVSDDKLYAIAHRAAERDIRLNVQASGGKAIDTILGIFDRVNREIPITSKRFVIVHSQFPSEQNMRDAARLGVIPTTVTNFLWGQGNAYIKYYGQESANQAVPLKSWLAYGVPVVQSTDYGPSDGDVHLVAVHREKKTDGPEKPWARRRASRANRRSVSIRSTAPGSLLAQTRSVRWKKESWRISWSWIGTL